MVETHDGTIGVYRELGRGTSFTKERVTYL